MVQVFHESDRRRIIRRSLVPAEKIQINFELDGRSIQGLIATINKNGLKVDAITNIDFFSREKLPLMTEAVISGPNFEKDYHIKDLCVKRVSATQDKTTLIVFTTESSDAKALLWQIMYKLDHTNDQGVVYERIEDDRYLRIPGRGHYTERARLERVAFIRDHTKMPLEVLDNLGLIAERLTSNIENLIGSVEIPVGLAGPLLFNGQKAKGITYAPFATTEGALVASATRGATAMTRSGGVTTRVLKQQMIRVPYFAFKDLNSASAFSYWIMDHVEEVKKEIRKVSRFANLTAIEPMVNGASVHVKFMYETGDAAGQNMTTTCTWHACMWILEAIKLYPNLNLKNFIIDANVSGDKKVNYLSFMIGRGTRVIAECFIYEEDLQKTLKVSSKQLAQTFHCLTQGAIRTGMIGFNVNIANVIASMFTALGQDIACVHESSIGVVNIEEAEGGIYASLLLPSLIIGTVGGGTGLPGQNQYLQILGCQGADKASKLAEIIAGYCLALDISTLSAVASGQFATAHEKLGRNRPIENLKIEELDLAFFQKSLANQTANLIKLDPLHRKEDGSSIITELTSRRLLKLMGHFPYSLAFEDGSSLRIMVKIKPLDSEILLMMNSLASMCHPNLAKAFRLHHLQLGFDKSHIREIAIFKQADPRFKDHAPQLYGSIEDPAREIYLLIMENIDELSHINTADKNISWDSASIQAVIEGLGSLHSIWWKREDELMRQPWIGTVMTNEIMGQLKDLWAAFGVHAATEFPEWFDQDILDEQLQLIETLPMWWKRLESQPRTLIHNDFNPRNIALRKVEGRYKLCAYDWELATIQVPQHDLAEFLIFVGSTDLSLDEIESWLEMHRQALMKATGDSICTSEWRAGFAASLRDLMIHRVSLYIMGHTMHHYKFIQRITENCRHMIGLTKPWLD